MIDRFKIACNNRDIDKTLEILKTIPLNYDRNFPIRLAVENNCIEIVEYLLNKPEVDPSDLGNIALITSAKMGYFEIFKMLLNHHKVKISIFDYFPFFAAIKHRHNNIIKYLIENKKVEPNIYNNKGIKLAFMKNNHELVYYFLSKRDVVETLDKSIIYNHEDIFDKNLLIFILKNSNIISQFDKKDIKYLKKILDNSIEKLLIEIIEYRLNELQGKKRLQFLNQILDNPNINNRSIFKKIKDKYIFNKNVS